MIFISLFLTLLLHFASCARDTTCDESQKHFSNICFTPKISEAFDVEKIFIQPEDGYYITMANDIARLHFAEILNGKLLTLQDNYTNSCFRTKFQLGSEGIDAYLTGFESLRGTWKCRLSKDNFGVSLCDATSSGPSKFHQNLSVYIAYTENKNFHLAAYCFPNGEAGWGVMSSTPSLTDEEKKVIAEKVKELGFPYEDFVTTYEDYCPQ